MVDKFNEALEDFKDALTNGEELEVALAAVAAEHGLRPEALRNRATTRWGDLAAHREKIFSGAALAARKAIAAERQLRSRYINNKINNGYKLNDEERKFNYWYFMNNLIAD
ncbi:hypothetical protein [Methylorubrum sp. POS3]|uniref:hypothetical protein n=1 Tax=Methylorubrum sp. POS3 TaxID=2998492 RepID=UPI003727368D